MLDILEFVYYDNYGIKWISKNTNPNSITLLKYYKPTWKTRSNHFTRYSDVKIKGFFFKSIIL